MIRLPRLKAKDLLRALKQAAFQIDRSRGSHFFVKHPDGRATAIPVHAGETIGPGLLRAIPRDLELTPEQLKDLLGK